MARRSVETPSPSAPLRAPRYGRYLLIILAGVIVYWPSLRGVYLLDDEVHIVANPGIRTLWPLGQHLADPDRGVVRLTLALNYAIGGIEPYGFHVFNLVVHLLAALTLYGLVRRTAERRLEQARRPTAGATPLAFAVALIWVVHPLTTQAVTYMIQRAESLMSLFYLLTLYSVARGATARHAGPWYVAAIAACGAGMGCKEVMITAPVVVLIYDRLFLADSWRGLFAKRWWVYLLMAATGGLMLGSGALAGVTGQASVNAAAVGFAFQGVTPWQYLISQPAVILHYLRLAAWPDPLCFDYDWPTATMSVGTVAAGVVVLILLVATAWAVYRRRAVGFPGAAFFLILAPTSSFVPIKDLAVEHRMYLPLAAVITLAIVALDRLFRTAPAAWRGAMLGGGVLVLGFLTFQRNTMYASAADLWGDVVAQRPGNARAWSHLGNAQLNAGMNDAAIESFRASLRAKPDWAEIENNLGNALARAGRSEEAAVALASALKHNPRLTQIHLNLGTLLHRLGRLNDAVEHYRAGRAESPQLVPPRNNLGIALRDLGRLAEAEAAHRTALQYAPNDIATRYHLAYVLELQGRLPDAANEYQQILRIDPRNADAKARLAAIQSQPKQ